MQTYIFDKTNDTDIAFYQIRERLITLLRSRFTTYGYKQIQTPTFEPYDLYTTVNGTIKLDEMIKVIDNSGKVLVMRPDVTIPITQQIASKYKHLSKEIRYFYVTDVFRQTPDESNNKERTQAGIEYFGNNSPEADAEVLSLAVHLLKDLHLTNFTLEIGHAGFTKELISELALSDQDLKQFKQLIQAKNTNGIKLFLADLSIDPKLRYAIENIPLLYGEADDVIKRAKEIAYNDSMVNKLQNLEEVCTVIQAYGCKQHIVIDLGLINHMDYYSDIIFQGFTENVGKPILMGGRYDKLATQFNASIPAIGFACDIEALLDSTKNHTKSYQPPIDVDIYYETDEQEYGLTIANELREQNYRVLTFPIPEANKHESAQCTLYLTRNNSTLYQQNKSWSFTDIEKLNQILQEVKERI
ncbi:ATP phosphoribosyltransferase regulatory subunit [Virgibacillus alimentarius]|uniref:ATP phosphoribosyltransferase regulatory subunit n=1 Tax=Virgibacillus alimentarius TaxID=698769 RepID=A0ABS4S6W9_9BACI|nr:MULTISPECIES: ATP phosphoribosyltransferase regulatory subunit [Virgibacillus]MBP2257253.1 ATP phosphoribosyltransferase regulatory subunit [Virgibacillus alimentarius]HLR67365.1 ATP phosphoribosyltransferase regulatory subunit [Virgibacillus sp.]